MKCAVVIDIYLVNITSIRGVQELEIDFLDGPKEGTHQKETEQFTYFCIETGLSKSRTHHTHGVHAEGNFCHSCMNNCGKCSSIYICTVREAVMTFITMIFSSQALICMRGALIELYLSRLNIS